MKNSSIKNLNELPEHSSLITSERLAAFQCQNQKALTEIQEVSHSKSQIFKKNIFFLLLIVMILILPTYLILSALLNQISEKKAMQQKRMLQQYSRMDDFTLPVTTNAQTAPRWVHLSPQKGTVLEYNPLKTISSQPSLLNLSAKDEEKEAISVIFENNNQLNFEIVADITGQKLKLASKLLDLSFETNKDARLIFDYERRYYEKKYQISQYEELPMCIIIPTFNNVQKQRYKQNLQSIIQQQYKNYKVIVIDDHSEDKTGDQIQRLIANKRLSTNQFVVIKNEVRMKALKNIHTAAKTFCKSEDIMIIIDGDDQLVGRQVFKLFNAAFQKQKVWFVYSNFIDMVTKTVGYSRPFPDLTLRTQEYRHELFYTSHLRAFYASLFLKIKDQDLKNGAGEYFQAANDVAICIPILEMAGERVKYIPEITYGYNSNTGSNNHIVRLYQQKQNDKFIRTFPKYQRLQKL